MYFLPTTTQANDLFRYYDGAFTEEECQKIIALGKNFSQGLIGDSDEGKPTLFTNTRNSLVDWISWSEENDWIFKKLSEIITDVNSAFWGFHLKGFFEPLQITKYEENGFYNWHQDSGNGPFSIRKLSVIVQLTPEKEYEGGEVEIMPPKQLLPKKQGTVIVFPSYQCHRVLPVTKGIRHSLVAWISGEPYR